MSGNGVFYGDLESLATHLGSVELGEPVRLIDVASLDMGFFLALTDPSENQVLCTNDIGTYPTITLVSTEVLTCDAFGGSNPPDGPAL